MADPARSIVAEADEEPLDPHAAVQAVEATITRLTSRLARYEAQIEELRWQLWFAKLSRQRRAALAAQARERGLEEPESFEAARAVVWGDHVASLHTQEELRAMATGDDLHTAITLDEWLNEGE